MSRSGVKVVGAVAAGVIGIGLLGNAAFGFLSGPDDDHGTVVRVIDGDTLVAEVAGEETTIRLLNIDTPETKDPDLPVQCLGPEATAFLTERLPAGTEIDLEYDEERVDRYGRTLAGVFTDDSLVNAEIAAAGLGVPVLFEPNDRFLHVVEKAARTAEREAVGLYAASIDCTLSAQLAQVEQAVEQVPTTVDGDPAAALENAQSVVDTAGSFALDLSDTDLAGLGNLVIAASTRTDHLDGLIVDAGSARDTAASRRDALQDAKTAYDEEQERLEQERLEKEQEEQEEKERKEREAREEEQREQERREKESAPATSKAPSSSAGSTSKKSSKGSSTTGSSEEKSSKRSSGGSGTSSKGSSDEKSSKGTSSTKGTSDGKSSKGSSSSEGSSSSKGKSSGKSSTSESSEGSSKKSSGCEPYGPEIPYSDDGGYTGKRYGMPGGKTFRKCR